MTRESVIGRGRRFAEAAMTDRATLRRATGAYVTDPVTLEEVPEMGVILTGVPCKVKYIGEATELVPGQSTSQTTVEWHVPWDTEGVLVDDQVTIDSTSPTGDPDLPGTQFRIVGPFPKSYSTSKRFRVEGWF